MFGSHKVKSKVTAGESQAVFDAAGYESTSTNSSSTMLRKNQENSAGRKQHVEGRDQNGCAIRYIDRLLRSQIRWPLRGLSFSMYLYIESA